MALAPGTKLGSFEIDALLGSGGMGEVYRATDTSLGRAVAIKVLPEPVAADAERLARFDREARTLAALNHPRIAQVYGVEGSGPTRALVMELVEGEDLNVRIARGPIPVDEAVPLARQIAEALEAAHEAGIIHRDLKPANIKVRPDGTVKVLDFGLARPGGAATNSGSSPLLTASLTSPAMTMHGAILGTAAYMAPEQAKGRPVDRRADVWAFGCVLYEMLTGRRAFPGDDVSETIASILAREPDFGVLPATIAPPLRTLITRCLARDRDQRVASLSTAIYVLTSGLEVQEPARATATLAPASRRPLWRRALPAAAAAILASAAVAGVAWMRWPSPAAAPVTRFSFTLPPGQSYTNNNRQLVAVSPDGTRIVYVARGTLHMRSLGDAEPHPIGGSEVRGAGVYSPVFSPDGEWIAFWTGGTLKKIPIGGGTASTFHTERTPSFGMTWDETGLLFAHVQKGIVRVSPDDGASEVLIPARAGETMYGPQLLPDRRHVLYTVATGDPSLPTINDGRVVVQAIGGSDVSRVVSGVDGRYLPTGHVLYRSGDKVLAVRFDLERRAVDSAPVEVAVASTSVSAMPFATHLAVAPAGTLAYVQAADRQDIGVLDRRGQITKRLGLPEGTYSTPRVSPDGTRVAYSERSETPNVWIAQLDRDAPPRRLTFEGRNRFPTWSADGQYLAFSSDRDGQQAIYQQRADGAGTVERLTNPPAGITHFPQAFSPDGQHLLLNQFTGEQRGSLWIWTRKDGSLQGVPGEPVGSSATFSADGRWFAYTDGGASFVRPFPPTSARYQVPIPEQSANMGIHPVWSPKTKELLYSVGPGMLASAPVTLGSTVEFGTPTVVQMPGVGDRATRSWDVMPDGQHLVRVIETNHDGTSVSPIHVVVNWLDELKRRLPPR